MKCPYCMGEDSKVVDSRPSNDKSIRRRRECLSCGKRYTTYETIEIMPIMVIKRGGERQIFSRTKVLEGMIKACEKRPVSMAALEAAATEVEQQVQNLMIDEVDSKYIGEQVMEQLRRLDQVSYVRFASVYREFKDLEAFRKELVSLIDRM